MSLQRGQIKANEIIINHQNNQNGMKIHNDKIASRKTYNIR